MENLTESENLNMTKENLETETIADLDQVTLVAGEPLESGRAVVVNSEGQAIHAALGVSESDINLAVERLVLPSDAAIDMMRYLLPGESYTFTRQTIKPRVLAVLSIDDLIIDDVARVPRPSRGSRGFCQARIESAERTAEFISERDNMILIEAFSTRRFPQARIDEWGRAVQSLNPPKPVSCIGCTNYHGQSYGGNKLICAIHPTGVEGDTCGDWEGKSEPNL